METVYGKGGIFVKVVADSVHNGARLTTLSCHYHRFIHSEVMTHRMFSRNASSSRAIPVKKMLERVRESPAMPIHWGKNKPGMQANEECHKEVMLVENDQSFELHREAAWQTVAEQSVENADAFDEAGYHKQIVNRLTEPFQFIDVLITATEWDNFFNLRLHPDAQPEIYELARRMKEAMDDSTPRELLPGQWHTPYAGKAISDLEERRLASAGRCARVSYLNHDQTYPVVSKDVELAKRLLEAGHMSPFEHQATPIVPRTYHETMSGGWERGVTHMDLDLNLWSGNFQGWVQYRHFI